MQEHARLSAPLGQGDVINGKYVLERVIVRGGISVVWLARHLHPEASPDGQPYFALKVLNEHVTRHAAVVEALHREATKAQNLVHPNIVDVWSFEHTGNDYFITMECLIGETLDEFIKRHGKRGIGKAKSLEIIAKLAAGLSYAHAQGVVHSDFKPANAFVTSDGQVKILDFGIARAVRMDDTARADTVFDSATFGAYASCELLYGAEPNVANDVYGLACVVYELLAGRHPFNKKSAAMALQEDLTPATVKGLTRTQNKALQHALALREQDRTPSVARFLAEMNQRSAIPAVFYAGLLLLLVIVGMLVMWPSQQLNDVKQRAVAGLFKSGPVVEVEKDDVAPVPADDIIRPDPANADEFAAINRDARQDRQATDFDAGRLVQDQTARQVAEIRANFDQAIGQPTFDLETAQRLLDDLDKLSDLGKPFPSGQYVVIERLIMQVDDLDAQGKTAEAIDLVVSIRGLVLDSVELQNLQARLDAKSRAIAPSDDGVVQNDDAISASDDAIVQTDDVIAPNEDVIVQNDNAQSLRSEEQQLRVLLAAPGFGSDWEAQLQQRFADLQDVGGSDPIVAASARVIAETYLKEARRQRIENRALADAQRYLAQAERYDPEVPGLALEAVAVSAAMASLRADAERRPVAAPAPDVFSAMAEDVCSRSSLAGNGAKAGLFCNDLLKDGTAGPILVVVPAGGPLAAPLAISKYEVSVQAYNHYCVADPACMPSNVASNLYHPVAGITIAQAQAYINWLSNQTGQLYRLPTANEWEYAAAASEKWPDRSRNCQASSGADSTTGLSLSAVNAGGTVNAWGLFHYLDNAREWVLVGKDLYVRGGSYIDTIDDCNIRLSEPHTGQADPYTGFRIVREIRN